ncbi:tyrosine-type recombinase/integrase [Paraburkholderia sediminicola]|uniref:tyrosine-type recombinase/integrase n=1 Tax=Paraburkholderia sediminicola TaxID=458836 RepID=UPI0038B7AB60
MNDELHRDVPLLVTAHGKPVAVPCAWFRHLAKTGHRRIGIRQTARNLVLFWRWLQVPVSKSGTNMAATKSVRWDSVTDDILILYRSACLARGNINRTVNAKLSVVYRFFWWAQEHRYVENRIGNGTMQCGKLYPIQITRYQVRGRWYIESGLLLGDAERAQLPIPNNKEVDDAFVRLANNADEGIRIRNVLMLNWVLTTGIRRSELLVLSYTLLLASRALSREDGRLPIEITGKGGKERTVYATGQLLDETLSYWGNERSAVLKLTTLLKAPDAVFISHTSGRPISDRQINRIFKDAFVDSASRVHTHRVRAKFATDFINENVDAEVERVGIHNVHIEFLLDALAQVLGHSDKRTLRRYVQIRLRWHAQGFGRLQRTRDC